MTTSQVQGHTAWDHAGHAYERSWATEDLDVAARAIKRGAIVGEWLEGDEIQWLNPPPSDSRSSTRAARQWLEAQVRGRGPFAYSLWRRPKSEESLLLVFWAC